MLAESRRQFYLEPFLENYFTYPKCLPCYELLFEYLSKYNDTELACEFRSNKNYRKIYEFLSQEYITHLSRYLISQFKKSDLEPKRILEIGAGDGFLSQSLRQQLNSHNIEVIATDPGIEPIKKLYEVENLDAQKAINKHPAPIIICSWMPRELDLTPIFRKSPFNSEYILIGDPNVCGTSESWCSCEDYKQQPIQSDYYNQFGITDSPAEGKFKSRTYSFKRVS